jgi:hypothetical protein
MVKVLEDMVLPSGRRTMDTSGSCRWRIDLVSEDVFGERFGDSQIEPSQQLDQGFASAADQYRQAIMPVGGGGDTSNGTEHAHGDFAVSDQLRDIGQEQGCDRGFLTGWIVPYAAGSIVSDRLAAICQGGNSSK